MRNFKLLFITTFSLLFLVAGVKPIDQQYTGEINILSNPGFENGLDDWDESDGTFSRESSDVYLGTTSSKWDSDGSGQFLDSDAVTIPKALQGKLCILEFNYKGGDAGLKFVSYYVSAYVG